MHLRILAAFAFMVVIKAAQAVGIDFDASQELHRMSPLLTGVCIEDVNQEIYGGAGDGP
jgi:hypothetical protein